MSAYLKQFKILIVDDQNFIRQMLRRILGVLGGRRISEAKDVEDAWKQILSTGSFDFLIVDWEMLEMDGLELVKRIRHDDASPNIFLPIIMLTAHSEKSRITIARDAGVNEYVIKPISPKALFDRIVMIIEHPRKYIRNKDFFGPDRRRQKALFEGEERRKEVQDSKDIHEDSDEAVENLG